MEQNQAVNPLALEELRLLEMERELKEGLPFLYGWQWYDWADEFYNSTNRINLLVAANQISKSSTQIRKCINWATNKALWKNLWGLMVPNQFWYLYPSKDVATAEFETKWSQFLPRGKYKEDPVYGWEEEYDGKDIKLIRFNSGVILYFKTYAQDPHKLQSGTVFALFADEEMPYEIYDELMFRLSATGGYFHMVFTATKGQEFWRQCMEEKGRFEKLKTAWKRCVSMYDCLTYMDGSSTPWTIKKIKQIEATCGTEAEVQRRVHGRFVKSTGLRYPTFEFKQHVVQPLPEAQNWLVYAGVDIGSGGENHPAAIVFVALRPDRKRARIIKAWRGIGVKTTAGDVLAQYRMMARGHTVVQAFYDWASREFGNLAESAGVSFIRADKARDRGDLTINALLKNNMLLLEDIPEVHDVGYELARLSVNDNKRSTSDDLADGLRYAITGMPFDWEETEAEEKKEAEPEDERRNGRAGPEDTLLLGEDEFDEWNELYEV